MNSRMETIRRLRASLGNQIPMIAGMWASNVALVLNAETTMYVGNHVRRANQTTAKPTSTPMEMDIPGSKVIAMTVTLIFSLELVKSAIIERMIAMAEPIWKTPT